MKAPDLGRLRPRSPSSLSWKLLFGILPLVVFAVSGIVWLQYNMARREILNAINKEMRFRAQRTASTIDDLLDQRYRDLFTLSESSLIVDYYRNVDFKLLNEAGAYRKELERYLLNFAARNRVYAQILYLDRKGREVCAVRARPSLAREKSEQANYFLKASTAGVGGWWSSSIENLAGVGPVIYYAKPVHDDLGTLKGVLVLCYDLTQLRELLMNIEVGARGRAYILAAGGRRLEGRAGINERGLLTASSVLARQPWTLVLEAPLEDFLGPLRTVRNTAVLTALIGLAGC